MKVTERTVTVRHRLVLEWYKEITSDLDDTSLCRHLEANLINRSSLVHNLFESLDHIRKTGRGAVIANCVTIRNVKEIENEPNE